MEIRVTNEMGFNESSVYVDLNKVYETFYKALPENNRYFLSILFSLKDVHLSINKNNDIVKCTLDHKLYVMPENLELYSGLFKSLYDEQILDDVISKICKYYNYDWKMNQDGTIVLQFRDEYGNSTVRGRNGQEHFEYKSIDALFEDWYTVILQTYKKTNSLKKELNFIEDYLQDLNPTLGKSR